MIAKLNNEDIAVANDIRTVFQASYAVEAELLNVSDFPPLKRTLDGYRSCGNTFYGYTEDQELAGVIEMHHKGGITYIDSLVVHPRFFRRGVARKLLSYMIDKYDSARYIVETGAENTPALKLYKACGFKQVEEWDMDIGIRKVRLERG
ncbi:MAG: GNAT family N-acetyltransferase [Cyclobacteriaceae bacterium]